ncbi:MAG: PAS domain S-box protein [Proteobacteria bacterium]|nr:PAS domain S-box protein [Pseudomonadota bacterium]MBU4296927.1 PAS domain S-box protein [Pseudomonadota bacterium]MCG2746091.1 PAS domain S-box protein [Desulfobulbaceae bacterium]
MSSLSDILQKLASGQIVADLPAECECREQLLNLIKYLNELRHFVAALSSGDLDATLRLTGPLAGNLKGLHANLRHLTWQTQQVAAGDFSQRVDFMGGFSDAFNSMVTSLAQDREDLEKRVQERTADLHYANERLRRELHERQLAQESLLRYSEEIHNLYNLAPCGYHSLDGDGIFIRINDTELQWLGYSREEIIGKMKVSDLMTKKSVQNFLNNFPQLKERGWVKDLEFEMVCKDGSILPVLLSATAVYDDDGNYVMSLSTIYDITERKKEEERLMLAKAANPLTGLPGNVSIQHVINEKLSSGTPFDIAYIDIDNFKPYNDFYGFEKGDLVINSLAKIIVSVINLSDVKESSFCGHIGGDDFILITNPYRAEQIATEIIREFDAHLELFHGKHDFHDGFYSAVNRNGVEETFHLLSLSFGILNTLLTPNDSYAQLASIATDVKKSAKKIPGSSIFINKRAR